MLTPDNCLAVLTEKLKRPSISLNFIEYCQTFKDYCLTELVLKMCFATT